MRDDEIETPIPLVPGLEAPRRRRCGPWDERADGFHVCRKCGRLDPLDFLDLEDDES